MKKFLLAFLLSVSAFAQQGIFPGNGNGSNLLSQKVVYTSKLAGVTGGVAVVPGSSATSTTDSATALNAAIASGNIDLEVDSGYALSTSLVLSSNTTIHCIAPQYGFIMQTGSNLPVLMNAHQNAPTTASGTGGFLPSNITDVGITIKGCMLNANSVQAVTGTISGGAAHTISGSTGLFVTGVMFDAVQNLNFISNEIYDSGIWAFFYSNSLYANISNNYLHQPTPTVTSKFTDGIHCIGPCQFSWIQNNRINAGDDSIALNADDGNRTGLSGPAFNASQWPGVKWGPVTDAHVDSNTFDAGFYGLRLFTATELIDRIFVTNTSGTLCGNTGLIDAETALGNGNVGKVKIDGWTVQTDGTCNTFGVPFNFQITANYSEVDIGGVKIDKPGVNWPVVTTANVASGGMLNFHDWEINTPTGNLLSNIIVTNGPTYGLSLSNILWSNSATDTTSRLISGSSVPVTLSISNFDGPLGQMVAAGYNPTGQSQMYNGRATFQDIAGTPALFTSTSAGINVQLSAAGADLWDDGLTGHVRYWFDPSTSVTFATGDQSVGFKWAWFNNQDAICMGATTNPTSGTACDTGISRLAAGSWAMGNGTPADFTGTLKLGTLNAVTAIQANGTPGVTKTCTVLPTVVNGIITSC